MQSEGEFVPDCMLDFLGQCKIRKLVRSER